MDLTVVAPSEPIALAVPYIPPTGDIRTEIESLVRREGIITVARVYAALALHFELTNRDLALRTSSASFRGQTEVKFYNRVRQAVRKLKVDGKVRTMPGLKGVWEHVTHSF